VEARVNRGRAERDRQRRILRVAASVTRLLIIRVLAETPLAAGDLAQVIGRSAAATSQHIRLLRDVDAIEATRSGNVVRYRIAKHPTARILEALARSFDSPSD